MKKQERITMSVRFTHKNKPEGVMGLYGETLSYGKDEFMSLQDMACGVLLRMFNWFSSFMEPADVLKARDKIVEFLQAVAYREESLADEA